ncbi:MAG: cation:proton antiporter [Candidatus Woesearchaeota archaeon]
MEQYIIYLFYIAVLLILGILITAVCTTLRMSNILFLVIAGFILQRFGFAYFNTEIILVLSALALILIVLETSMKFNIAHIVKNFLLVLKFNVVYFFVSTYIITLAVFLLFDLPFKGFEAFVLCFLLSIIIYGVDPIIAMEFFHLKKTKLREMLEIEGIISGPIVVIFAFFVISYLQSTMEIAEGIIGVTFHLLQQVFIALLLGIFLAYMVYKIIHNFVMEKELSALMIITIAIALFAISEFVNANGTLAVAIYGIFLHGLTKETLQRRYTSMVTHILYIIVFILFGMEFFFPESALLLKVFGLLVVYLIVRFMCLMIFMKDLNIKEKVFMTLNVAKGIEVAIVLFIMKLNFAHLPGIDLILSIGFMFFIMSYVLATIVNYFSDYFLDHHRHHAKHAHTS